MDRVRKHLSPALVLGMVAVFVALGGGAYAALGKNSVGSKQIKKNAVVTSKLKNNAVTAAKIKSGSVTTTKLKNGAVTGAKVDTASLGTVPSAQNAETLTGHLLLPQTRLVASSAATEAAARAAATKAPVFNVGPISIYAKCFTDTSGPSTRLEYYIETTQNGFLFQGDNGDADGTPFLNTDTPESDRLLMDDSAGLNNSSVYMMHSNEVDVSGPGGLAFEARLQIGVKNGTLPLGNGIFGEGDACIIAGDLTKYSG